MEEKFFHHTFSVLWGETYELITVTPSVFPAEGEQLAKQNWWVVCQLSVAAYNIFYNRYRNLIIRFKLLWRQSTSIAVQDGAFWWAGFGQDFTSVLGDGCLLRKPIRWVCQGWLRLLGHFTPDLLLTFMYTPTAKQFVIFCFQNQARNHIREYLLLKTSHWAIQQRNI